MKSLFNVDEELFFISSDNLDTIKNKLYGFIISNNGIIDKDNFCVDDIKRPDGCGYYVLVEKINNKINIYQDFNGSYGLYFFQFEDYYAISNSYQYLVDHIKLSYKLSIDRDYANHMFAMQYTGMSYNRTMFNEIKILDKNVAIHIDCDSKEILFEHIDYHDFSVILDSYEGIYILDKWIEKWIKIFRGIKLKTDNMQIALSGGFDTRISFMIMLLSGIDLNQIRVDSIKGDVYSFKEDYEIASEIAEKYGFSLNKECMDNEGDFYTQEDIINMMLYNNLYCHRQMDVFDRKYKMKQYHVRGDGGECVRAYFMDSPHDFTRKLCKRSQSNKVNTAVENIMNDSYKKIRQIRDIRDENSVEISWRMFRDVSNRTHFGTHAVNSLRSNVYRITPLIDPLLWQLKLSTDGCSDYNLLMAVMYMRYCPELLGFKFDNNKSIDDTTLHYAKQISDRYPLNKDILFENKDKERFDIIVKDESVTGNKTNNDSNLSYDEIFKRIFLSKRCQNMFFLEFDVQTYYNAWRFYTTNKYYPLQGICTTIATLKALLDMNYIGQENNNAYMDIMKIYDEAELGDNSFLEYMDGQQSYYEIIRFIINNRDNINSLTNLCTKKGYNKVIIYGYGALGKLIYQELSASNVKITGVMDAYLDYKKAKLSKEIMLSLNDSKSEYDVIFVTVIDQFKEIKKTLLEYNHHDIVNIRDLILVK